MRIVSMVLVGDGVILEVVGLRLGGREKPLRTLQSRESLTPFLISSRSERVTIHLQTG